MNTVYTELLKNDKILDACTVIGSALVALYHAPAHDGKEQELDLQDACASLFSEVSEAGLSTSPARDTRAICGGLLMRMRTYHRSMAYHDETVHCLKGCRFFFRAVVAMNLFDEYGENDQEQA